MKVGRESTRSGYRAMRHIGEAGVIVLSLLFPADFPGFPVSGAFAAGTAAVDDETGAAADATTGEAADQVALARRLRELEALVESLQAEVERLRASIGQSTTRVDLEQRIEALTLDIERLRIGEAAAPVAGEPAHGFGPAASKVYRVKNGVSVGGYGEMLYQNFADEGDDGSPAPGSKADTLDFLRAVLYFGYKFTDRFIFNSEIEFEHAIAGGGKDGEVAVEFAFIDFKATRRFGVRGGLLLVPVGFVNELHEPPIFHGARRPDVERYIIPTTWRENGAGVYGDAGPVTYKAYVVASLDGTGLSEGGGIRGGRQGGSSSRADDFALTARVDFSPVPGFILGASGYSGRVGHDTVGLEEARVSLWDAHLEWRWRGFHLRGLYARTIVSDAEAIGIAAGAATGIGERQAGWYGEFAWNVLAPAGGTEQELSPFVRYEAFDTQARVAPGEMIDPANQRLVRTYGLTYRPIPNIAVKVDFQNLANGAGSAVDQVNVALGYLF